jgi:hypothetical protein
VHQQPVPADAAPVVRSEFEENEPPEFEENEPPQKGPALPFREPYNLDKTRERARAYLASSLTLLLATVVLILVVAVTARSYPTKEAVDLLGVLLSPLVALVGAATGFYYGGKTK